MIVISTQINQEHITITSYLHSYSYPTPIHEIYDDSLRHFMILQHSRMPMASYLMVEILCDTGDFVGDQAP